MKQTTNKFNPSEHLIDIKGKAYMPVASRLVWFREEHPDWSIETEQVEKGIDYSVFKTTIKNEVGRVIATAHKREDKVGFFDYMEKSETGSLGRSLAMCSYGTQFAPELEEGTERIVDSPIVPKMQPKGISTPPLVAPTSTEEEPSLPQWKLYHSLIKQLNLDPVKAKEKAMTKFKLWRFTDITKTQLMEINTALTDSVGKKDKEVVKPAEIPNFTSEKVLE